MAKLAIFGALLAAVGLITSCSGSGSARSSSPAASSPVTTSSSSSPSPSTVPESKTFRSATYGYAVALPADWASIQAVAKWDGRSGLNYASSSVDQFIASSGTIAFGVAAPWSRGLAAYTTFLVTETHKYHGEFCPLKPDKRDPVTIGGQRGILLAYNCGILINMAATVHRGVGYWFTFRDENVDAATDPTDHATFLRILRSVKFLD